MCVSCLDGMIVNSGKFYCIIIFLKEIFCIMFGMVVVCVSGVGISVVFVIFVLMFK